MRILVVDDEPRHVAGMLRLLSRMRPNAEVKGAYSGEEALKTIHEWKPDILLTDIRMESMDGLTLIGRIPENQRQMMRIVIMSAYDLFTYARQAMRLGAVDYLLKPVDEEELNHLLGGFDEPSDLNAEKANESTIQYIISYMKEHLDEDISLERFADECHYNPNYLSVLFRQRMGIPFSVYQRNIRVERAVELLLNTSINVNSIAEQVGYHTTGYFIRTFRSIYGMAPGQYRRMKKRT